MHQGAELASTFLVKLGPVLPCRRRRINLEHAFKLFLELCGIVGPRLNRRKFIFLRFTSHVVRCRPVCLSPSVNTSSMV